MCVCVCLSCIVVGVVVVVVVVVVVFDKISYLDCVFHFCAVCW